MNSQAQSINRQTSQEAGLRSTVSLQRKCECGQHTPGGGACNACSRKQPTIRRHSEVGLTGRGPAIPAIVNETLHSAGRPLDSNTRGFMEPRFGQDFSHVRVHTDAKAAASADAISAQAYTVGRDVVFAAGRFAPETRTGQRLLAHELTHVVQQASGQLALNGAPSLGQVDDPAELEADHVADAVLAGHRISPGPAALESGSVIRRQVRGSDEAPPTGPGPSQPSAGPTCGPDVTPQVTAAVANTRSTFAGWSNSDKRGACDALDSLLTGAFAWDIVELHNNAWILAYRPACATQGATPPCGSTVKMGTDCYYAGSPNYVIYGVMCKLCNAHFTAISDAPAAARFTQAKMEYWINYYKGTGSSGTSTPSGNFIPSKNWAIAGYTGWPAVASPAGDRNTCAPNCPTAYAGGAFHVNWVPRGTF